MADFRADVVAGLSKNPKSLPCKHFYDEEGSKLFDRITELDAYYPTRTELRILEAHVAEMAEAIGPRALIVEPGAGSVLKIRKLLDALQDPVGFVPVDISGEHLRASTAELKALYPDLWIHPLEADFSIELDLPDPPLGRSRPRKRVVFFPGSTLGNFETAAARHLLQRIADFVGAEGGLLLGTDLVPRPGGKQLETLLRAYDDPEGVTAAFNLNLLARINRELDGDFDLDRFEHVVRYDAEHARIEMYLRSRIDQTVHASGHELTFAAGDTILTEHSHKYSRASLIALCEGTGLELRGWWSDPEEWFALSYWEKARS